MITRPGIRYIETYRRQMRKKKHSMSIGIRVIIISLPYSVLMFIFRGRKRNWGPSYSRILLDHLYRHLFEKECRFGSRCREVKDFRVWKKRWAVRLLMHVYVQSDIFWERMTRYTWTFTRTPIMCKVSGLRGLSPNLFFFTQDQSTKLSRLTGYLRNWSPLPRSSLPRVVSSLPHCKRLHTPGSLPRG